MKGVRKIYKYHYGLARVQLDNGKEAFVDRQGKLKRGRYDYVDSYSEDLSRVQLDNGEWAFIDRQGNLREGRYEYAESYNDGMACVKLEDGSYAFVDRDGNLQEGRYEYADSYSEGLAHVQLENEMHAFIDQQGNLQEGRYIDARSYNKGFADVSLNFGKWCEVDHKGNIYLSEKEWEKYLLNRPQAYKFIPPHRFEDEVFIKRVNDVIKKILTSYINDIQLDLSEIHESTEELQRRLTYANSIMDIVDAKNKEVIEQRNRQLEWIEKIKNEQSKNKEEIEIEKFENLKKDALNKIRTLGV